MNDDRRLLTVTEAMRFLAVRGRSTFDRLCRRHRLPRVVLNQRLIRYRLADLERLTSRVMERAG